MSLKQKLMSRGLFQRVATGPDAADRLAQNWAYRCIKAARDAYERTGGDDPMFLILQAAMGLTPTAYPYLQHFAIVDEDGIIRTNRYTSETDRDTAWRICTAEDLKDNLMRLAMAVQLPDDHVRALYACVAKWIRYDDREGQGTTAKERLTRH